MPWGGRGFSLAAKMRLARELHPVSHARKRSSHAHAQLSLHADPGGQQGALWCRASCTQLGGLGRCLAPRGDLGPALTKVSKWRASEWKGRFTPHLALKIFLNFLNKICPLSPSSGLSLACGHSCCPSPVHALPWGAMMTAKTWKQSRCPSTDGYRNSGVSTLRNTTQS